MLRKIKFRVWSKEFKKFKGKGMSRPHALTGVDVQDGIWILRYSQQENFVVQQFTGLQDKNGKDIYEGDIIFWKVNPPNSPIVESSHGEIVYLDNDARFGLRMPAYGITYTLGGFIMNENLAVVSNVFENPELLK